MSRRPLIETRRVAEATPVEGKPGRFLIGLITPGWGSSGYYSPAVLEQAAKDKVFPAGTHMYVDHPTESEEFERPERSIRDLAAVLAEDAYWDGQRLVAEATIFSFWRTRLGDMKQAIGSSIRASAEVTEGGEAEGRPGRIIDRLIASVGNSCDFVTHAGRGGSIIAVLESARVEESRNIGQWIESRIHRDFTVLADDMAGDGRLTREERIGLSSAIGDALAAFVGKLEAEQPQLYTRDLWDDPADTVSTASEAAMVARAVLAGVAEATANDTREALQNALREAYGAEKSWVWVRDFDESTVWFEHETPDECGTYAEGYSLDDAGAVTLAGERTLVRARTEYVPVNPAGRSTTTESEEDTMPQIEESELARLREAAGRVQTLESERDTAVQRADTAESERDQLREANTVAERAATVARIVGEAATAAQVELGEDLMAGIATRAVYAQDGSVNEAETRRVADERIAALAEANGTGTIRGFGAGTTPTSGITEAEYLAGLGITVKGA